jgi:hypothetical protein
LPRRSLGEVGSAPPFGPLGPNLESHASRTCELSRDLGNVRGGAGLRSAASKHRAPKATSKKRVGPAVASAKAEASAAFLSLRGSSPGLPRRSLGEVGSAPPLFIPLGTPGNSQGVLKHPEHILLSLRDITSTETLRSNTRKYPVIPPLPRCDG